MAQIGNIPEIIQVKNRLNELKLDGLVKDWELPYENLLTRLTAAIFFLTPTQESEVDQIWKVFNENEMFHVRKNEEKKLSQLEWRLEFNKGYEV